jgi:hypothetical protein
MNFSSYVWSGDFWFLVVSGQFEKIAKNVEFVNKHFVVLMNRLVTTKINPRKIANILTIHFEETHLSHFL